MNKLARIAEMIRSSRLRQGLTQQQLAARAGVSLATLQNLEAGTGNPALGTLMSLIDPLGLSFRLESRSLDLDSLISCGVPLMGNETSLRPHRAFLVDTLRAQASAILKLKAAGRPGAAILSFLSALQDHYPTVWNEVDSALGTWVHRSRKSISPKLRRLALSRLSEYL